MTMEALPIEVLTHILQYLSPIDRLRSEQVCKKWRHATRHTWRDVQILSIIEPNEADYHCRFRNRTKPHEFIEKEDNCLFIGTDCPKIIRCLVSRVGCFIKKLMIHYPWTFNYPAILSVVNSYCNSLKIFETGSVSGDHDEKSFTRLFQCNKELNSIQCHESFHFIEAIPLRNWKSLHFGYYEKLHENKIVSLIEHSEALEEFKIVKYTKRIVEALLKCPNLKSLYFQANRKVSLAVIFDVPLLNRLTNLSVCGPHFDPNLFSNMLQHCYHLKKLRILDSSNDSLVKLLETIEALPVLETLQLCSFSITDDMLIHLINVKNLCFDNYSSYHQITQNGILQLIKKSKNLQKLDLQTIPVTLEMFKQLVGEMSDRPKYLKVMVRFDYFYVVSKICAGSKIRVVREMECFEK